MKPHHVLRPLSLVFTFSLAFSASAAINTAAIVSSTLSPQCLETRAGGSCYWLFCTNFGCKVRTWTTVRHYIPDAVLSAYANTGLSPWSEVAGMGSPTSTAQAGGDGTTNHVAENNMAK